MPHEAFADENSPPRQNTPSKLASPKHLPTAAASCGLVVEVASPDLEPLMIAGSSEEGMQLCAICFAQPRCVRNRPCGHAVCCGLCTIKATKPSEKLYRCPTCRQSVEEVEWHGEYPPKPMATDGRLIEAGIAVRSDIQTFLQARAEGPDQTLADASRLVLAAWGMPSSRCEDQTQAAFPLIAAAEAGDVATVTELLAIGEIDVNLSDGEGWTALIAAASEGHADVVATILAADGDGTVGTVDVDAYNQDCETALMRAALNGSANIVSALLHARADVNCQTRHGKTALIIAASTGRLDIVNLLLGVNHIEVNLSDSAGKTALMHAVSEGHTAVASALRVRARELMQEKVKTARAAQTARGEAGAPAT